MTTDQGTCRRPPAALLKRGPSWGPLVSWARNRDGNAAVEMAFIAPVLLIMLLGMSEATDVMMVDRKVTSVTSSTADLVARVREIDSEGLNDVFSAARAIMDPYPTTGILSIKITSLTMDTYNNVRVHWSAATSGTSAYTTGSSYSKSIPQGVLAANESVILAEIEYAYPGPHTDFIWGPTTLTAKYYAKPRRSRTVLRCNDLSLSSPYCY